MPLNAKYNEYRLGAEPTKEILVLDEADDFSREWTGGRVVFVLAPMSRKAEFQMSNLAKGLMYYTDKVLFYTAANIA